MKLLRWLVLIFLLVACQPSTPPTVTLIENNQVITLQTDERVPSAILNQAGITLNPNDRVLLNGFPTALDQSITTSPITLQIRRAVPLTILSSNGQQQIQSSAFTVGEVLIEALIWLRAEDKIEPVLNSPVTTGMSITISSVRDLTVSVDGKVLQIQSSARTVGEALAEAGIPLLGLATSLPAESEALPSDGQIKVTRVSESILLTQKPLPFQSELVASADVPLDQTQILQPGENGLTVQRIRIRFEDGQEILRTTENETVVRPPKTRVLGYGTKVEIKTAVVDGVQIEYWRAVQMYATAYSPCRSGGDQCYSGTSSGKKLAKGMVGLRYSWYLAMGGQPLYIPGYGFATVEDVCGGCVGKPWIDLGYSDDDYQHWSSWVTVYFLTPVPPNVIYVLE
jgi:uncharacterized protein YabE (DUF348 family)